MAKQNKPDAAPDKLEGGVTPTSAEIQDLEQLEKLIVAETGSLPAPGEPESEATLVKLLARATGLVAETDGLRNRAQVVTKKTEEKLEAAKQQLEANEQVKRELAKESKLLDERKRDLDKKEREVLDAREVVTERETVVEAGFSERRKEILGTLDEQIALLREQRETLIREQAATRLAEAAEREKRADHRAALERAEDAAREKLADDARKELGIELAAERKRQLEDLAMEREGIRSRDAGANEAERLKIESARAEIEAERKKLRADRNALAGDREILDEDRRSLDARVQRLTAARVSTLLADITALTEQRDAAIATRDRYFAGLEAHKEMERLLGGRRADELLAQIDGLERKNAELNAELGKRLSSGAQSRLTGLEAERSEWLEERTVLRHKLAEAENRIGQQRAGAIKFETLRAQTEALETNKKLMEAALQELRAEVDKYTQADEKRNPMEALLAIDRDERLSIEVRTLAPVGGGTKTLKEFADDLRHRVATGVEGRTLFYSERDIRCFLGGISMSRLLLLQGISGTGKTSLPLAFAGAISAGAEVVEVQAGWRDRQDLVGYFNAFHRHYYATNFLQALYRAGTPAFEDRPYLIILDEINLSRVEQFFADFLSALEQPQAKRRLTLMNDPVAQPPRLMLEGRHLPIPPNVWFVGTANHDETTTDFADKTYDRAHVMELPRRDPKKDSFEVKERRAREPISYLKLEDAFSQAAVARKAEVSRVVEWLRSDAGIAGPLDRRFRIGWGNRLEEQAKRFVPVVVEAGGSVGEAMDHLLHTRVFRKLRDRHDVRHKALEEFKKTFEDAWGSLDRENPPLRSLALIDRELAAKKDE